MVTRTENVLNKFSKRGITCGDISLYLAVLRPSQGSGFCMCLFLHINLTGIILFHGLHGFLTQSICTGTKYMFRLFLRSFWLPCMPPPCLMRRECVFLALSSHDYFRETSFHESKSLRTYFFRPNDGRSSQVCAPLMTQPKHYAWYTQLAQLVNAHKRKHKHGKGCGQMEPSRWSYLIPKWHKNISHGEEHSPLSASILYACALLPPREYTG
jgi:hypothetical protein